MGKSESTENGNGNGTRMDFRSSASTLYRKVSECYREAHLNNTEDPIDEISLTHNRHLPGIGTEYPISCRHPITKDVFGWLMYGGKDEDMDDAYSAHFYLNTDGDLTDRIDRIKNIINPNINPKFNKDTRTIGQVEPTPLGKLNRAVGKGSGPVAYRCEESRTRKPLQL